MGRENREYVVTRPGKKGGISVGALLSRYPEVKLLEDLDESTSLVQMSASVCKRIRQEHSDLVIEPNLPYSLL